MKISLLSIGLAALILTGCDSIPFLGQSQTALENLVAVNTAGTYTVQVLKDGQVLVSETWICTQDQGKLTGCHKQPTAQ